MKMTVMEIRHAKTPKLRQLAVAQRDEIYKLEVQVEELQKTIENWQGHIQKLEAEVEKLEAPIEMILFCPMCKARHIDKGKFATQPHKSHACQGCGFTWSPSHRHTVGVEFLPGYKNDSEDAD